MITTNIKTYSELIRLPTFIERFRYLKLDGKVGMDTFGHDRYLNQALYTSPEWKRFRRGIILRDNGCDLACSDYVIPNGIKIMIHHLNPLTIQDVLRRDPKVFDPENVVCTWLRTHNAIHYGDEELLVTEPITRSANDTCPWKR